ncbi:MAG: hypothetical protein AAF806_13355 [Bacteroidota bacterium]
MEKQFFSSDKILSLSAMFISLCTLIVFVYQTRLIREQQHMSVLPYLQMGNGGTHTPNYVYGLRNTGIGPAILTDIKVQKGEGKIFTDINPYIKANRNPKDTIGYYHTNIKVGTLIPEKEVIELIKLYDGKIKNGQKLYDVLNDPDLRIEIEYQSVYGDKWKITNQESVPQKLTK